MDHTIGGPPGAKTAKGVCCLLYQVPSSWPRLSPSRFMRALCHHYDLELQHFSPNAITVATIFAAVCEGYLG